MFSFDDIYSCKQGDILICKLFSFRLNQLCIDRMVRAKQTRSNFQDDDDGDDDDDDDDDDCDDNADVDDGDYLDGVYCLKGKF